MEDAKILYITSQLLNTDRRTSLSIPFSVKHREAGYVFVKIVNIFGTVYQPFLLTTKSFYVNVKSTFEFIVSALCMCITFLF